MAMTVFRSRPDGTQQSCERVETVVALKTEGKTGADDYFSDLERKELISMIRSGQADMFRAAYAMATLIERGHMTQTELAGALSLSQSAVANKLRLLRLSEAEREAILRTGLSERHARALLRLRDERVRSCALERVIRERMSVSETERLVLDLSSEGEMPPRREKGHIRDLRFFSNSIDRAVSIATRAGLVLELRRHESERHLEILIRIEKSQNQKAPS